MLYIPEKNGAQKIWPRFLVNDAQGIAETAYPFNAGERGLADLRVYLQTRGKNSMPFICPRQIWNTRHSEHTHAFYKDEQEEGKLIDTTLTKQNTRWWKCRKGTGIAMDATDAQEDALELEFEQTPITEGEHQPGR